MRAVTGGGPALMPTTVKLGGLGWFIDLPPGSGRVLKKVRSDETVVRFHQSNSLLNKADIRCDAKPTAILGLAR